MSEWLKPLPEAVRSWERFGKAILAQPKWTLAAFLGDGEAAVRLEAVGLPASVSAELADDPTLAEPSWMQNAEGLDDIIHQTRFVRRLALWGPEVLMHAALVSAEYQAARQVLPRGAMARLRDDALAAVRIWLASPQAPEAIAAVRDVAERGSRKYRPHEQNPDTPKAEQVWLELGAPWCAAEAAAGDWTLAEYDGPGPRQASFTWGNRMSVWPGRAVETASEFGSYSEVQAAIRSALLAWTGDASPTPAVSA